jgi:hypothetical protein
LGSGSPEKRFELVASYNLCVELRFKLLATPVSNESPIIVRNENVARFSGMGLEDHSIAKLTSLTISQAIAGSREAPIADDLEDLFQCNTVGGPKRFVPSGLAPHSRLSDRVQANKMDLRAFDLSICDTDARNLEALVPSRAQKVVNREDIGVKCNAHH